MKSKNHDKEHGILIIPREKEILITTPDGREIGSLVIDTAEKHKYPEKGVELTESFYLQFVPAKACADSGMRDIAFVAVNYDNRTSVSAVGKASLK